MPISHRDRPVYRAVLSEAFRIAWKHRRYWPLAFCASFLLTAGSYDVLLTAVDAIATQATVLLGTGTSSASATVRALLTNNGSVFDWMSGVQVFLVGVLFCLVFVIVSIIAQGGLVYAIGAVKRGKSPTLLEAFRVGGGAFWPVAGLNALMLSTLWILRFLVSIPLYLAMEGTEPGLWFLYFLSFLVFVALAFFVSLIHIFALNALILQGAPVGLAVIRGYDVVKRNWVVAVETALLLFVIAVGISSAAVVAFFFGTIPLLAALVAALSTGSVAVFSLVLGIALALLVLAGFALAAFLTQFQYATWTLLYRRLGEGGALPKLHRWVRTFFGITGVPQK